MRYDEIALKVFDNGDFSIAFIAQLGERQTEDLKVPRSIRGEGIFCLVKYS